MADNVELNAGSGGAVLATDEDGVSAHHQYVKIEFGADGTQTPVSAANPLPVTGPLTDTELRATAVPVSGTVTASGPLTDTQLRATAVPISGTVTANAGTNLNTSALATQATLNSLNTKVTACNTGSVTVISTVPGVGATNLGKATDAVAGATDTGVAALAVRTDTLGTLTPANGDYARLRLNNRGAVWMKPDGNVTVDGTVTANLGTIAGVATEVTSAAILADTAAMDTNLATIAGDTTSLDSKIAVVDIDTGAGTDNVQVATLKLATVGGGSGQVLNWIGCDSTPYYRGLPTVLFDGSSLNPLGSSINPIYMQGPSGAASLRVQGTQDHDAADAQAPIKIGGKATTSEPAAVSDADRVNAYFDANGYQHVKTHAGGDIEVVQPTAADLNVTEASAASILSDTTAIKAAVETIDNAISGTEMQVDVVASLPAGTNAIGKLAANSGVDIGDVDVTSAPARVATTDAITAKLATDNIQNGLTACTPVFVSISAASSGDNTLVAAAGASNKIRVLSYTLIAAGAVTVAFESGASGTALTGDMSIAETGGISCAFSPVGHFETAANTLLNLELSASVQVSGHLTYIVVQ